MNDWSRLSACSILGSSRLEGRPNYKVPAPLEQLRTLDERHQKKLDPTKLPDFTVRGRPAKVTETCCGHRLGSERERVTAFEFNFSTPDSQSAFSGLADGRFPFRRGGGHGYQEIARPVSTASGGGILRRGPLFRR